MGTDYNFVFFYPMNYIFEIILNGIDDMANATKCAIDCSKPFNEKDFLFDEFKNDNKICFVITGIYDLYGDVLIHFLRDMYLDCKIVYLIGDLFEVKSKAYGISLENARRDFDYLITFDRKEASKYGFLYHTFPFDSFHITNDQVEYDVAYVGAAKNRLDKLIEIHDSVVAQGYSCKFIIVGATDRGVDGGIEYRSIKEAIPFKETLQIMAKSKCILSILQEGGYSVDIRFFESLFYEKFFLTNCLELFECEEYKNINKNAYLYEQGMSFSFLDKLPQTIMNEEIKRKYSSEMFLDYLMSLFKE